MVATRSMFPYAAVLAAALTLASCSGRDPATAETVPAPPVATSSSSVPSPTSSAPPRSAAPTEAEDPVLTKIPKEARPETPEGAEAFAAHFLTALSGAAQKADPTPLIGLTRDWCETCRAMITSIYALQKGGHHHAGETLG